MRSRSATGCCGSWSPRLPEWTRGASPRPRLRLRRSRVRGGRGAGGAERPRAGCGPADPRAPARAQRWVLVDAAPAILPEIPSRLGRYTHRELERRGVEIHVGTTLESFTGAEAVLSNGTRVPARTLVWAAGVRPNPVVAASRAARRRARPGRGRRDPGRARAARTSGRSATARRCRTPRRPAGSTRRPASTLSARPAASPRTSPARRSRTATACWARSRRSAATRASPTSCGIRLRGFPGWFVTRSYHLYALPMLRRKARVMADWTVSLLFRRDVAELSALGHPRRLDS